jgi:hypothetical protein
MTMLASSAQDIARAIAIDPLGDVYISGETRGNLGGLVVGDVDAFVAKFAAPIPEPSSRGIVAITCLMGLALRVLRTSLRKVA